MPTFCLPSSREKFFVDTESKMQGSETSNFIVHLFSNNGYYTYVSLLRRGKIPVPSKLIMDSAPWVNFYSDVELTKGLASVATSIILRKDVYNVFPLTNILHITLFALNKLLRIFPDIKESDKYFLSIAPPVPTLFLFSEGDKIIKSDKIKEVANYLQERGVEVHQKEFGPEVPHVNSFRMYEKTYSEVLDYFLGIKNTEIPGET